MVSTALNVPIAVGVLIPYAWALAEPGTPIVMNLYWALAGVSAAGFVDEAAPGMLSGRWGPFGPSAPWLQAAVARHNAGSGRRLL